jgi:poly(3-hydroxybutyrate) depolymerase
MEGGGDRALVARLRQLAIAAPEALVAGAGEEEAAELRAAHAAEVADALECARARARELLREAGGADPLSFLEAGPEVRAREGGPALAEQVGARLRARAEACRAFARLSEAAAELVPALLRLDRRVS